MVGEKKKNTQAGILRTYIEPAKNVRCSRRIGRLRNRTSHPTLSKVRKCRRGFAACSTGQFRSCSSSARGSCKMPKQATNSSTSIKARLSQIRFNLWKRNHAQLGKQQELNHETKETFRMKVAKSLSKAKGMFKLSRPKLRLGWFNPRGTNSPLTNFKYSYIFSNLCP